jgi:hypothetical protein
MTPQSASPAHFFARLYWMMFGPMALFVTTYIIGSSGGGWFTVADAVFAALLAGLLLARWVEFRGGNAQTSTGEPATAEHLRWYVLSTVVLGIGAWVIANVVANMG